MNVSFLAPKALCALVAGGSACVGGGIIYWYQLPTTWRELFIKEGKFFLLKETEYKGIYIDQKDKEHWTQESELKSATNNDGHSKVKTYCENNLDKKLSEFSDESSYDSTKRKLILLCTTDGIETVKGQLEQFGKSNWSTAEDDYKAVFAVFRYSQEFLDWLNKNKEHSEALNKDSKPSEKYTELKTKCETTLKKAHKEASLEEHNYVGWWCMPLTKTKIKDRIQHKHPDWQQENNGEQIKTRWKDTSSVTAKVKSDQNKSEDKELEGSDYKSWCDTHLEKKLTEDDSYQDKYIMLMSVCKKVEQEAG